MSFRMTRCSSCASSLSAWTRFPSPKLRKIHTSSRRQSLEVLAALGLGFYVNSQWVVLPSFLKTASVTVPLVAAAALAIHKNRRTHFDPLLNRRKYLSKTSHDMRVPNVTFLHGAGVEKANELLHDLVHVNMPEIPYLSHDSYQWRVIFFKDPSLWVDFVENGTLLCSKDIMSALTRNEMVILLSTQVAHVLARHKAECSSFRLLQSHAASIGAWYYAYFMPVLHSYPVDMSIIFVLHQIASNYFFQQKFRSLCLEADKLALVLGSGMGATRQDAVSMMQKLITVRQQLPITSRARAMCYYEYRISALKQNDPPSSSTYESPKNW